MALDLLVAGIPVPEYSVTVPWGISQAELYSLIPESEFVSHQDGPSTLFFDFLGVQAEFTFIFQTNSDDRFSLFMLWNVGSPDYTFTFDDVSARLIGKLGAPDEKGDTRLQWFDDFLYVEARNKLTRRPGTRVWLRFPAVIVQNSKYRPDAPHHIRYAEKQKWAEFERRVRQDQAFSDIIIQLHRARETHWASGTVATDSDLDRLRALALDCGIEESIDCPFEDTVSLFVQNIPTEQ